MTNLQLSPDLLEHGSWTRPLHCAAEMTFCAHAKAPQNHSPVCLSSGLAGVLAELHGWPHARGPQARGPKHITKPTRVLPCDLTGGDKEITSRNILADLSYAGALTDSHQAAGDTALWVRLIRSRLWAANVHQVRRAERPCEQWRCVWNMCISLCKVNIKCVFWVCHTTEKCVINHPAKFEC